MQGDKEYMFTSRHKHFLLTNLLWKNSNIQAINKIPFPTLKRDKKNKVQKETLKSDNYIISRGVAKSSLRDYVLFA